MKLTKNIRVMVKKERGDGNWLDVSETFIYSPEVCLNLPELILIWNPDGDQTEFVAGYLIKFTKYKK